MIRMVCETVIDCDLCDAQFTYDAILNNDQITSIAKTKGWDVICGLDYCPECARKFYEENE